MNRRSFISGILATSAAAALGSSGCGKSKPGKISLRYNTHWTGRDAHGATMDWLYGEFRRRNPEVDFQTVQIAGSVDSGQKLLAELAAGGGPDILHHVIWDLVRAGYALDITDFIKPRYDRFHPEALESCCWNGRYYGFPSEFSMTPCIWNTRILESIRREVPTTVDDYFRVGEALRRKGIWLTSFSCGGIHIFNCVLFAQPHARDYIAAQEWRSAPFVEAFRFIKRMVDARLIPPNETELQFSNGAALFQDGRLCHYLNGAWTIRNELTARGVDPELKDHLAFTPFPAIEGKRMLRAWVPTRAALNSALKDDPRKLEAAFAFLDLFSGKEAADKLISVAHSPGGVRAAITEEKAGPLLYHHWHSRDQADVLFTIPNNPGRWEQKSFFTAFPDASASLIEGGSVKAAISIFDESMDVIARLRPPRGEGIAGRRHRQMATRGVCGNSPPSPLRGEGQGEGDSVRGSEASPEGDSRRRRILTFPPGEKGLRGAGIGNWQQEACAVTVPSPLRGEGQGEGDSGDATWIENGV